MKKGKITGKKGLILLCAVAVFLLVQWMVIGWRYNFGPFKSLGRIRLAGMEGNAEQYDFSHIQVMENSPLKGENVLFLGSSVTNGAAALHQSIPEFFAARMGCSYIKEAVDGTTLVDSGKNSYIERMLAHVDPSARIDLLVCQLSTNDASKELPLGEIADGKELEDFDTATITGAIEYIICYAGKTWNCPVVFYTNARFDSENYQAMVDRLYQIQEKWGIGILDL